MAIIQSDVAKGVKTVPQAFTSGAVVAYRASFKFAAGTLYTASDIIELAILPASHEFVTATLIPEGDFTTTTADIGIMTGDVGSLDAARTSGDEVFEAVELDKLSSVSAITPFTLEKSDRDRSIGLKLSGDVTGADQTITLMVVMTQ